ncbi:MAG TPA: hypothetical protein PLI13_14410, partial [Paracoccus sp. (in: a-proteobacteria)]|nr:hypothetical protein [Paracoccus sp. (in: a-proteobacteria)]
WREGDRWHTEQRVALLSPETAETVGKAVGVLEGILRVADRTPSCTAAASRSMPALRKARVCYNHLAGDFGVRMLDRMVAEGDVTLDGDDAALTPSGEARVTALGIDVAGLKTQRRPVCRTCLDWSERRSHLAGRLGRAMLARMIELGWARRQADSRVIRFDREGERRFQAMFSA